ncbi:ATP-grasp domain-containing protein [Leucobacter sp. CSA1]|uniref:biotin carboxylase n=1 Tax=Leucobacter chromiisoli TaxID=2796471 RepID=A0A934QB84_9MICO|nr:biotin carboxylase N-terminal domain-containing protein [Leucobacter chromiisoli]MBK0420117.1 ATP-grasp domain-containing protein [Leucobacter chromiisoli]
MTHSSASEIGAVLIANRGEIAVRVVRAAREAGMRSIAVYADQDADALHVRLADEAYALEGTTPAESYLDIAKLLAAAERSGADAVHPGYGFLSESAAFARAVGEAGLTWIGPDPETIELLGDKARARALAQQVGAPLVPGTNEPVADAAEVIAFADVHGLPVAIKAVHGGGGRGMRVVRERDRIAEAYESAVREARTAFGQGDCLVERFLERPRHIEAQVLGDRHGRVAVLGTRDCSLQRRNQKLVEEAPAPFLPDELRERIHRAAADICAAAGYVGAGTVEFLLGADGTLSFLEVNTRLQVEHPVTEMVTGIDLVQEQFRVAAGEPMDVPAEIPAFGHAFEFRINAEDPALGFLPTPGALTRFDPPSGQGVRLDAGFTAGQTVPGTFDSLLAKLVVWGRDRDEALARSRRALGEFAVEGVATVLPFHRFVVADPAFTAVGGPGGASGFGVHTRWIEEECTADFAAAEAVPEPAAARLVRVPIELDGRRAVLGLPGSLLATLGTAGASGAADAAGAEGDELGGDRDAAADPGAVLAPFTGTLSAWKVDAGAWVDEGETVAIVEAMKMEVPVRAPRAGVLRRSAEAGETVAARALIGSIEA